MNYFPQKPWLIVVLAACAALWSGSVCGQDKSSGETGSLVGRIAYIEGRLLRYMPDEDDWVLTDVDTPFGEYDNVFSSEDGKAEFIMPNNTLLRIGGDTQVQLIALTATVTEINVASGTARLYNKSSAAEIRATTPFGEVTMPPGTVCDIFVSESQAEIASVQGKVAFTQPGSSARHDVIAGSSSIIATPENIAASAHSAPEAWDGWNVDRDVRWTQRMQARGESKKYLPESLQDHAADLDTNGRWERVNYEGSYRYFWRPVYVHAGWTPFSSGRWMLWRGDHTWVPCEPFGYVTHHYGNWVYAGDYWYWAPPVSYVMVSSGLPLLNVGFSWYPGRVAWVSSGFSIGWFPLAPYEMYYCNRYWGPWSRVRHYHHYYDCRRYRHHRHARFIEHRHFHRAKDYRHAGLRGPHRGEKFRGSALVPEELRRHFKADNKHRLASTMPEFRDKVKKIDTRRDRRFAGNRLNANPFKREIDKGFENKRGPGAGVKHTSARVVKNTRQEQRRLEAAAKNALKPRFENSAVNRKTVAVKSENRKPGVRAERRSLRQAEKVTLNRRPDTAKVQKPHSFSSQKTGSSRQTQYASNAPRMSAARERGSVRGGSSGRLNVGNTSSVRQPVTGRSRHSFSAQSSGAGRSGSSYTRPAATSSANRSSSRAGSSYSRSGSTFSNSRSYAGSGSVRGGFGIQRGQAGTAGGMRGYSGGGRR